MVFGIPFPLSDRSHHVQRRVVKDTRPSAINYIQYVSPTPLSLVREGGRIAPSTLSPGPPDVLLGKGNPVRAPLFRRGRLDGTATASASPLP